MSFKSPMSYISCPVSLQYYPCFLSQTPHPFTLLRGQQACTHRASSFARARAVMQYQQLSKTKLVQWMHDASLQGFYHWSNPWHTSTGGKVSLRAKYSVRTESNYLTDLVRSLPRFLHFALFSDDLDLTWGVQDLTEEEHKVLKVVWACLLCQRQEC